MNQNTATMTDEPTRHTTDLDLESVDVGDRIDPTIVPGIETGVGDPIDAHAARRGEQTATYDVDMLARVLPDRYDATQEALILDPETGTLARISGHTRSGAMNQPERDWKVREVGVALRLTDIISHEIPDLESFFEDTPESFVSEWFDEFCYELERGNEDWRLSEFRAGGEIRLNDHDNREAVVEYELVGEN